MLVGVNYAWKSYGADFGPPPVGDAGHPWCARAAWARTIDQELAEFRRLGFFAVRWFVLCDGIGIGTGDRAPRRDGFGRWRFGPPPPIGAEHLADLRFLLERFRAARV